MIGAEDADGSGNISFEEFVSKRFSSHPAGFLSEMEHVADEKQTVDGSLGTDESSRMLQVEQRLKRLERRARKASQEASQGSSARSWSSAISSNDNISGGCKSKAAAMLDQAHQINERLAKLTETTPREVQQHVRALEQKISELESELAACTKHAIHGSEDRKSTPSGTVFEDESAPGHPTEAAKANVSMDSSEAAKQALQITKTALEEQVKQNKRLTKNEAVIAAKQKEQQVAHAKCQEELKEESARLKHIAAKYDALMKDHEMAQAVYQAQQEENERLKITLTSHEADKMESQDARSTEQTRNEESKQFQSMSLGSSAAEVIALKNELQEARAALDAQQVQNQKLSSSFESRVSSYKAELQEACQPTLEEKERLNNSHLGVRAAEYRSFKKGLKNMQVGQQFQQGENDSSQGMTPEIAELKSQLQEAQALQQIQKSENEELRKGEPRVPYAEYAELELELKIQVQKAKTFECSQEAQHTSASPNGVSRAEYATLEAELEVAQQTQSDRMEQFKQRFEARQEQSVQLKVRAELLQQKSEAEAEIEELRHELNSTIQADQSQALRQQLVALREEYESFKGMAIRPEDHSALQQLLDHRVREYDVLKHKLEGLLHDFENFRRSAIQPEQYIALSLELEGRIKEGESLKQQVATLNAECMTLKKSLDEHNALQRKFEELTWQCETLRETQSKTVSQESYGV